MFQVNFVRYIKKWTKVNIPKKLNDIGSYNSNNRSLNTVTVKFL